MPNDLTLSERIGALGDDVREQFADIDFRDPANWPPVPRYTLLVCVSLLVLGLWWYVALGDSYDELINLKAKEVQLRESFRKKLSKTSYLTSFKQQRDQVRGYVQDLELQLPDQNGMNELLTEMNRLGSLRHLQFELFRPAPVIRKPFYVEMPISFRLLGSFHNVAAFAADMAHMQRVVHMQDISIASRPDSSLTVDGTFRVYRQLDKAEAALANAVKADNK